MLLLLGAFVAGIITVFAPCVFALLPVIVGGSMTGNVKDKRRPVIIAASLAISLILFTLLLKFVTLFVDVPPQVYTYISGGIIVAIGLLMLFPNVYDWVIIQFNLQAWSQRTLSASGKGHGAIIGAIVTGAALGPVFSSCSPVYAYILASVLPVNFGVAFFYIVAYVVGLSGMLLLVGYLGQKIIRKIRWAANPRGWFQRIVAALFILVGILIVTGWNTQFQVWIANHTPFDFNGLSAKLIPAGNGAHKQVGGVLNVTPYDAPALTGISTWINSTPLTLDQLKGKVVLIDFWTYSCINCIRTQPYIKDLYAKYHSAGLEIIGVHAPEFSFEKNPDNVRKAVKDAGITYPVAMDNDLKTWAAFGNQYWPATYLIDKDGQVRRTNFGEGQYADDETAVRDLLAEKGGKVPAVSMTTNPTPDSGNITPETYLGLARASNYIGPDSLTYGDSTYKAASLDSVNQWTISGTWNEGDESLTAVKDSVLKYRVAAQDVYLVVGNNATGAIGVKLNGKPISSTSMAGSDIKNSQVNVSQARLYKIVESSSYQLDETVELDVPAGIELNTFTFG